MSTRLTAPATAHPSAQAARSTASDARAFPARIRSVSADAVASGSSPAAARSALFPAYCSRHPVEPQGHGGPEGRREVADLAGPAVAAGQRRPAEDDGPPDTRLARDVDEVARAALVGPAAATRPCETPGRLRCRRRAAGHRGPRRGRPAASTSDHPRLGARSSRPESGETIPGTARPAPTRTAPGAEATASAARTVRRSRTSAGSEALRSSATTRRTWTTPQGPPRGRRGSRR